MYEIRNQLGNVPDVDGLKNEIISAHEKDKTSFKWDGQTIVITGHFKREGVTTINVHIEGIS